MSRRLSILATLLLAAAAANTLPFVNAESVQLASCPQEPDVIGHFYNNGETCVRDREVLTRDIVKVTCPQNYKYRSGWCRQKFHRRIRPSCPKDYTRFLGAKGECHSPCPPNYIESYGQCTLPRASVSTKFMTCPPYDQEGRVQHRNGAYCCSQELGNCPRPQCKIGDHVPGKFYYENGICIRQAESIPRVTVPKLKGARLGSSLAANNNTRICPEGKIPYRSICQAPCPEGFKPMKGKCELRSCQYDTHSDLVVTCPEGTYKLPVAIL